MDIPEDGSIDAGLEILSRVMPYGISLSTGDIAKVCGCSKSYIQEIERRAMQKLSIGLQERLDKDVVERILYPR